MGKRGPQTTCVHLDSRGGSYVLRRSPCWQPFISLGLCAGPAFKPEIPVSRSARAALAPNGTMGTHVVPSDRRHRVGLCWKSLCHSAGRGTFAVVDLVPRQGLFRDSTRVLNCCNDCMVQSCRDLGGALACLCGHACLGMLCSGVCHLCTAIPKIFALAGEGSCLFMGPRVHSRVVAVTGEIVEFSQRLPRVSCPVCSSTSTRQHVLCWLCIGMRMVSPGSRRGRLEITRRRRLERMDPGTVVPGLTVVYATSDRQ